MGAKCLLCGADAGQGFLCPKCDPPRKSKSLSSSLPQAASAAVSAAVAIDEFPKAPVVPFPIESSSLAITSLANILIAAGAAAVIIGADRSVKFVTDETRRMFGQSNADLATIMQVERFASIRIGDLSMGETWQLPVRNLVATLVPLSGGASGAVLVFRHAESSADDTSPGTKAPRLNELLDSVRDRFAPFADLKGIRLQIDGADFDERFKDHDGLADSLGILIDNSLHYVMPGGQVVAGYRVMDHKGKPLLLFFVMDSGPMVPDHMRQVIFEPGYVWNPASRERTGRSLYRVRDFAVKHGGSVWAEARTGKACTFFLRVRPDSAR
jgi:hypothetical protein